jgi:hypothetical protein
MNDPKVKDRKVMLGNLGELCFSLYTLCENQNQNQKALEVTKLHNDIIKELHGEKSTQYAQSLFLRAKSLMVNQGDKVEQMAILEAAIRIEEENNKNKSTKSLLLGRMHFCRATIMQSAKCFKEAKASYEKAKEVF